MQFTPQTMDNPCIITTDTAPCRLHLNQHWMLLPDYAFVRGLDGDETDFHIFADIYCNAMEPLLRLTAHDAGLFSSVSH